MTAVPTTPAQIGAALVALLLYGFGVGWAAGGRPCPGCLQRAGQGRNA